MKSNRIKRSEIKEKVLDVSCGLLATAIDITLFAFFQSCNLLIEGLKGRSVGIATSRATEASIDEVMNCGIDKETVKKTLWKVVHKGLVKRNSQNKNLLQITNQGLLRLKKILPVYFKERKWDKHLYIITYDIPEKLSGKRQLLRDNLRKMGAGMLQASVWITPYNPKNILREIIEKEDIPGSVIVSDLGEDGNIGEQDIDDLVDKVYELQKINERYLDFIANIRKKKFSKSQAYFSFLSILKEDPQLPFEILPFNWAGDKALGYLEEYTS